MKDDMTANLEALLARGTDNPGLRLALATRYLAADRVEDAVRHAAAAVALDSSYSAGWKLLGRAQAQAGNTVEAADSFRRGIEVAEERGDQQAAKEMRVFLKRLERSSP